VLEDRLSPATLTVNSTADTASDSDPYLSLREAIALVNSPTLPTDLSPQILGQIAGTLHDGEADTIAFDPAAVTGPIVLGGTQLMLSLPASTASVTLDGGSAGVTLDGNGQSSILEVNTGVQAALDHLTITHGRPGSGSDAGGGIYNLGTLTVSNSTITANSALSGGGIFNSGTLTVSSSTLESNTSTYAVFGGGGGGILNDTRGNLTVSNCTLSTNSAFVGGGIDNAGTLTVSNSTLSANSASYGGGIDNPGVLTVSSSILFANFDSGIFNYGGTVTVTGSTLSANSSSSFAGGIENLGGGGNRYPGTVTVTSSTINSNQGAGICNDFGTLTVTNSTIAANSTGIDNNLLGTLTVTNSTISANSAAQGGGIYNNSGTLTVTNSTLSANSAASGGGIYSTSPTVRMLLQNTIVAGNRANIGPDIYGVVDSASSNNLVGAGDNTLSGISTGPGGNLVGRMANPIDPRLGPLADNGGPTLTQALLDDSPARGAGSLDFATDTDQRGQPRVVDGQLDLGAYQTPTVAAPQVVPSDPDALIDPPVDHVRLIFNHTMDPTSLTPDQFGLSGPGGSVALTGVTAVPSTNGQQFEVSFASQTQPGDYALVVDASVRDIHGTPLGNSSTERFRVAGLIGCILTVNSTLDTADPGDPYLTLREAIALVNSLSLPDGLSPQILVQINGTLHDQGGDLIEFDPTSVTGAITLGGTQLDLSLPASTAHIGIDGGTTGVTIDGNNATRIFQVDAGAEVVLSHLTLTHGKASGSGAVASGGGLLASAGSNVTVSNCLLVGNSANYQGAGIAAAGILTVSNSRLTGNTSEAGYGAGLCAVTGSSVTVSGSTLANNYGYQGGGILTYTASSVTVSDSVLMANSAANAGGISAGGSVTVIRSTLMYNRVVFNGGGIFAAGSVTVSDSFLEGNSAFIGSTTQDGGGGGIAGEGNCSVTVSNCTLVGNVSRDRGAGILLHDIAYGGSMTVSNCTLVGNSASNAGGGIMDGQWMTVSNCTLVGNTARAAGGLGSYNGAHQNSVLTVNNSILTGNSALVGAGPDLAGVVDSSSAYNLVGIGDSTLRGISDGVDGNQIGTPASPIDPLLGTLGDHGGATQTIPLLAGSPALNAGDPDQGGTPDQRGVVRSGGVNVGAFQASATLLVVVAPNSVIAGLPFDVSVAAFDPYGQPAVGYTGTITFSSADPHPATLPMDYSFSLADGGSHTFTGQTSLYTAGIQDLTATDTANGLTGSASVLVTAGAGVTFQVMAPSSAVSGTPFDVTVVAVDAYGNIDTNYNGTIHFTTSDSDLGVVLPPDYTFQPSDAGTVTFPLGVTLITPGAQTLTVADLSSGIIGSTTITL
jgi:hypothetical protein